MEQLEISQIVNKQKEYFRTKQTFSVAYRLKALRRLKQAIVENEDKILEALHQDLGKSGFEGYMSEVGMVLDELSYVIKHLNKWAKAKRVATPLAQFAASSYTQPTPYGTVLIMSPWNYPFLLTLDPLVDALAAGNTVILKPSAYSPKVSKVIKELLNQVFQECYVSVIEGGRKENTALLDQPFDYIFFTGSKAVGQEVMAKAAVHLTPISLELGGKSPCIVDKTADIKLAAKRIVFGKYLNCGQTCVAPDYLYCDETIHDELVKQLINQIHLQFSSQPLNNPNYGHIINQKHFDRLNSLIDTNKVIEGGTSKGETLQIAPTIMDQVNWDDEVMKQEIFGPILPIITYKQLSEVEQELAKHDHPLAFYYFSSDLKLAKEVIKRNQFGGGCINDTIIHLATNKMGFGGVGGSGMGSYHGKIGFETFSHRKSIVDKKCWLDLPMRYQPYKSLHDKMIRFFLK